MQTKEDNEKDSYQEARDAANKAVEREAQDASKTEKAADPKSSTNEAPKEETKEEGE
jgi:hypothetical protein